jgi:hypothetical protein
LYDQIPSGCPQHEKANSCNTEFFVKNTKGSCCPIEGKDCVPELKNRFCNFDGSFNKQAYTDAKCDLPVCQKACDSYSLANGCECCPFPGFELDPLYNDAYTSYFDGSANVPEDCKSLNLFPVNAWQSFNKLKDADFAQDQQIPSLPPMGTVALLQALYGDLNALFTRPTKPVATLS